MYRNFVGARKAEGSVWATMISKYWSSGKLANSTESARSRLERFIVESIRLDALLDARARDIEFVNSGGEIYYSPDHSTWSAFFFPVEKGQEHKNSQDSAISGFAEVFADSDRTDDPFVSGSILSGKHATGIAWPRSYDHNF